ncbi:hypothetical protein ACFQGE_15700 [Halomicroarcula sp. GCM10025817]|uniref:hypothetical protein n=1 Tax=Haloarcula TaxID=2237 RepID=UPI0023E8C30E|nr:hypothetical protein [Halomicroarcula sp. SYNS111]
MSSEVSTGDRTVLGRTLGLLSNTAVAVRGAMTRRDGQSAFAVAAVVYLVVYLYGLSHLGTGPWGFELSAVENPLARAFRPVGPFQWEPVALLVVGPVELLVAPLNLALGGVLATLVGLNFGVSLVAWRGPKACRIGPGAGAAAGIPGLLSGVVCCGPTVLLVVGVQASAGVLTVFQWLLPVAVVALLGTLLWVGTKVQPDAV